MNNIGLLAVLAVTAAFVSGFGFGILFENRFDFIPNEAKLK